MKIIMIIIIILLILICFLILCACKVAGMADEHAEILSENQEKGN